jgi:L-threonylcarbamoyladenylate synthase
MSELAGPDDIAAAAAILRAGGVVAFPTETVYGLGARADDEAAVRRVFAIKGRPAEHPLIVHLASAAWLADWARHVSEAALGLAEAFWPGPLTLVLPRQPRVLDAVTGGQDSVALRVPAHPVALRLIGEAGALVAPSANRFGRVSPTTAAHVRDELGEAVDRVLDGGPCAVGVESTIVSLLGEPPALLRPGGIAPDEIEAVLGRPLARGGGALRAPGLLPAHYAPATRLELLPAGKMSDRAAWIVEQGRRVAVLALSEPGRALPGSAYRETMPGEAAAYARILYARLRALDAAGYDVLLVETPPDTPAWLAVQDRLGRAARAFSQA